jgi:hypothetical protein
MTDHDDHGMTDQARRALWRQWWTAREAWERDRTARMRALQGQILRGELSTAQLQRALTEYAVVRSALPPDMPAALRGLTCGAMAKGTRRPCKRRDLWRSGRCKLHGGKTPRRRPLTS